MFPQCYVIHLKRAREREENIIAQFRKMDNPMTLFPAIDCTDLESMVTNFNSLNPKSGPMCMSRQEFACYLSHACLLKYLYDFSRVDNVIVFEDDFVLKKDMSELVYVLERLKEIEFDMCFLGTLTNYTGENVNEVFTKVTSEHTGALWGTHAYVVSRAAIPKILEELREPNMAIDGKFQFISNTKINTYVVRENIFIQSETLPSTIRSIGYHQDSSFQDL